MADKDYDGTLPAAGGDLDAQKRAAKVALAAAESTGDTDGVKQAQAELDKLNRQLADLDEGTYRRQSADEAAKQRRNAAAVGDLRQSDEPQGRSATPRQRTDTPAKGTK